VLLETIEIHKDLELFWVYLKALFENYSKLSIVFLENLFEKTLKTKILFYCF
jgi:hypothetical protein